MLQPKFGEILIEIGNYLIQKKLNQIMNLTRIGTNSLFVKSQIFAVKSCLTSQRLVLSHDR